MIRTLLTVGFIALFVLGALLMRKGWRRRAAEQSSAIGALPTVPESLGEPLEHVNVRYLGSSMAPRWTHRLAVDGLGVRADGDITRYPEGVLLRRVSGAPLWIPAESIEAEWKVKDRKVIRWAPQSGVAIDTAFHQKDTAA
ncbi:hypothetical protein [Smaragdicoccus niigatensis]|uniref:PH-like domain-containing protein n=1 Tax=Smaragdicoccus niigatensis TaxID=359359 RepID=UPI00037CA8E4|nr:hypothetical protein [Smaragdicoccus niigatensis]